jgi:AAA family ATP:ADP antiporter
MKPDEMSKERLGPLERFLTLFTVVRPGEGVLALLLSLNIFLILTAYYILKPFREALILGQGSAELKSYMSAGQVLLLAAVVPLYAKLVARLPRRRLINVVTLFFVVCLVLFYGLRQVGVPLGILFFLWIGIFNLMIVAQFWSFANDIYTNEEGDGRAVTFPIHGGKEIGPPLFQKILRQLCVSLVRRVSETALSKAIELACLAVAHRQQI